MAANATAVYETTTGAGGKFRKKPFRRSQTTPYDRPTTALRPTQIETRKNGWISKLVEPASKLITSSAHKLFASVFRKRLLPPPIASTNSPDGNTEIVNLQPQATTVVIPAATQETIIGGVDNPSRNSDGDGITELEDILKQMTFSRSEIDRLSALLLSRTADNSGAAEKSSEPKDLYQQAIDDRYEDQTNAMTQEIKHLVSAATPTPAMKSDVLKEVASPAELAKAYMGSRPRQISPSMLSLNNQISRGCVPTFNNPPFRARSPSTSLLQKPFSDVGTSDNGFATPRYRGKSAIYCMARAPYSTIHPTTPFKDPDSSMGAHNGLFLSRKAMDNDQLNSSKKQVLKRRSSIFENDIGSVGPIRRIRQKTNLLHPKVPTLASSDAACSKQFNWKSQIHSFSKSVDNSMPGTSSAFVPAQSVRTAQKIFEQLDKFTPEKKSPDLKISIEGGTSPRKMTSAVLGSPTQRRIESADALKVSHISGDNRKEIDSPSKQSLMVEEARLKKAEMRCEDRSPEIGVEVRMPNSDTSHDIKVANDDSQTSLVQPPNKRAFQMSTNEDSLEADDGVQLNGHVSNELNEGDANTGSAKKSVSILDIPSQNEKQKSSSSSPLSKKDPELVSNGPVTSTNASAPPSALVSDDVMPNNELNLPISDFSAKSDKFSPLVFSTTSSAVESAVQKDTKLEVPNSSTDLVSNANGSAEKDTKGTQGSSVEVKKSEEAPAPGASTTNGPFSFGLHVSKQNIDNGLPSTTSSQNLFSTSFGKQSPPITSSVPSFLSGSISFSNGFPSSASTSSTAAPSGTTTNSIPNISPNSSQQASSVTISSVSSAPIFQFATSTASSTSAASASASTSALLSADNSGAKSSDIAFGNTTSTSLFSPVTSTGGSGFIFGSQASSSATPTSTSTPSFPSSGLFSSSSASVVSSASVSPTAVSSSSGTASSTIFSTNLQHSKPSFPTFTTSSVTGFSFGASTSGTSTNLSSSPAGNSSPFVFGGPTNTTSASTPVFSFGGNTISTPAAPPQPAFGNNVSTPALGFGSTPQGNGDQMCLEDSMTPTPVFGQPPSQPPASAGFVFGGQTTPSTGFGAGFVFGGQTTPSTGFGGAAAAPPCPGNPFQFGSQPNQMASPSPSPFQPSGSVEFGAGGSGSFSLGAAGDKSGRKYVKPRRLPKRK